MSGKRNKLRRKKLKQNFFEFVVCPECGAIVELNQFDNCQDLIIFEKGDFEAWPKGLLRN